MGTRPWSGKNHVKEGPNYPAVYVSWDDVQQFLKKLESMAGPGFRLPTEAEWEYACRAGSGEAYAFGKNASLLGEHAWYQAKEDYAQAVKKKKSEHMGSVRHAWKCRRMVQGFPRFLSNRKGGGS